MHAPRPVDAHFHGLFDSDFAWDAPIVLSADEMPAGMLVPEAAGAIRVDDARTLQSSLDTTVESFFEAHGFALLASPSAVDDWSFEATDTPQTSAGLRTFQAEVAQLIRERLLPNHRLEIYQSVPVRRGADAAIPEYATGVHQDYGLTPDDLCESLEAFAGAALSDWWRSTFERDEVAGFMMIDIWRPLHLERPLRHMPLALCEPGSVLPEDCVPVRYLGITPTGRPANQLCLRFQPTQRWWYYPDMTSDELLAFKLFQTFKGREGPTVDCCFHAAFEDPLAAPDEPPRRSCEHRVSVFVLRE